MFYVWVTAGANLLESTGILSSMGVSAGTSAAGEFSEAVDALGKISGGGVSVESLIGVFTVLASSIEGFTAALTAGPRLMVELGVPLPIAAFLHAPVALLAARLGIYALSGRDL